jgi:hypothetical protein
MGDVEKLKAEFHGEMLEILDEERNVGFSSSYFRKMVHEHGGVEAAHKLLKPDRQLPPMFEHLRKISRLDLAMESRVLKERYHELFSEDEREVACFRLKYGD